MFLTRELVDMSLPQIGFAFGGRDHTTVLHGCKTIDKSIQTSDAMAKVVDDIRRMIRDSK